MVFKKEQLIGFWVQRAAISIREALSKNLEDLEVNTSEGILLIVLAQHGPSPLVKLAELMEHAHPSVLRNIDSLESKGMVERLAHPEDRRVKLVQLTDVGRKLAGKVHDRIQEVNQRATEQFSPEELSGLLNGIKQLIGNLSDSDPLRVLEKLHNSFPSAKDSEQGS